MGLDVAGALDVPDKGADGPCPLLVDGDGLLVGHDGPQVVQRRGLPVQGTKTWRALYLASLAAVNEDPFDPRSMRGGQIDLVCLSARALFFLVDCVVTDPTPHASHGPAIRHDARTKSRNHTLGGR